MPNQTKLEIKQALADKYNHQAKITSSQERARRMRNRARKYQRQVDDMLRKAGQPVPRLTGSPKAAS